MPRPQARPIPPSDIALTAGVVRIANGRLETPGGVRRLTTKELELLTYLREREGSVVSKEELLTEVWDYRPGVATRAVENTVMRLRAKIELNPRDPDHVLTVVGTGYRFVGRTSATPAPVSQRSSGVPTNLRAFPTLLVGRRRELAQLGLALESHRVVTVLGPGGAGKTRLASEFGLQRGDAFDGGVFFVDLTTSRTEIDILAAIIRALGLVSAGDRNSKAIVARLGTLLAERGPTLLILDNCEQVRDDVAEAVPALIEAAPDLSVLATSRIALEIPDEYPMPLPELVPEEGAALFIDRARLVRADFAPDDGERPIIAEVCAALDGIPLAIELAAARSLVLSPTDLRDRLVAPLDVLKTASAGDSRHATLRRTYDWSWSLLTPAQQRAFATCSVFRGGFRLGDAEAVAAEPVIDEIEALCAHSLLRSAPDGSGLRFTLLETARTYAAEQLEALPELEAGAIRRHALRYLEIGEAHLAASRGPDLNRHIDAIEGDLPNFQAAFESLSKASPDEACRVALVMDRAIAIRGPWLRRVSLNRAAMAIVVSPKTRARLLFTRFRVHTGLGRGDLAEADAIEALALAREAGAPLIESGAMALFAESRMVQTAFEEALEGADQALVFARGIGDWHIEAKSYEIRGNSLRRIGRYAEAIEAHNRAVDLRRDNGDLYNMANQIMGIGTARMHQERYQEAAYHFEQAHRIYADHGDQVMAARLRGNIGALAMATEAPEVALERLLEAQVAFQQTGSARNGATSCINIAEMLLELNRPSEALAQIERGIRLMRGIHAPWYMAIAQGMRARIAHFFGDLEVARKHVVASIEAGVVQEKELRWLQCLLATIEADADRAAAAREALESGKSYEHEQIAALERFAERHIELAIARTALRSGDRDRAARLIARAQEEITNDLPRGLKQAITLLQRAIARTA